MRMSIFQLRDVARKIGVASPTSKKKAEIIRDYMAICEGREAPAKNQRRGRPPKVRVERASASAEKSEGTAPVQNKPEQPAEKPV